MGDLAAEPSPFDVTVTISGIGPGRCTITAILENGADGEGGDIEVCVTDTAQSSYGLDACIEALERWLNSTVRPEYRLDAALAMSDDGPFSVVATPDAGPYVLAPAHRRSDLAA